MADNKNLEKKDAKKDKKPGLGKRISKFFREYKSELKKISWPTLPEVIRNSLVTIAVVAIVGLFIWVVDLVLTFGRDALLKTDTGNNDPTYSSASDINNDFDIELNNKMAYYDLKFVPMSASDVPGAEAVVTATDATVYVVTEKGVIVSGTDITLNENDAKAALEKYAATLDPVPTVTNSDSDKQPAVTNSDDVSSTPAE